MTLLQKIRSLTWWNEITKLKDILTDLFSRSENLEERVEVLENPGGGGSQDLQSVTDNGNITTNPILINTTDLALSANTSLGSVNLLDGGGNSMVSADGSSYENTVVTSSDEAYISASSSTPLTGSQISARKDGSIAILTNGGIATYNGNEIATKSPISGTFANPTSITVTNGIITAIS